MSGKSLLQVNESDPEMWARGNASTPHYPQMSTWHCLQSQYSICAEWLTINVALPLATNYPLHWSRVAHLRMQKVIPSSQFVDCVTIKSHHYCMLYTAAQRVMVVGVVWCHRDATLCYMHWICLQSLLLQTGPLPCFMTGQQLERLVLDCEKKFSDDLDVLGTMPVSKCVHIQDCSQ